MRNISRLFILLLMMTLLMSCKKTLNSEVLPAHIAVNNSYYTQIVIQYEKNRYLTTNYRRGQLIPVNTRVKLLKITPNIIEVKLSSMSNSLLVKNAKKHTGDDIYRTFDKLFARNKVNLRKFSSVERKYIKRGSVAKGMRKKAVKVAIGYPPITKTSSLSSNSWVYWESRFNTFRVEFRNGKVSRIVD